MRDYQIQIEPFSFVTYEDIQINLQPNMHGSALIVGVILEEKEKDYVSTAISEIPVSIFAIDETYSKVNLFTGIIEDFHIYTEAGLRKLKLSLVTSSKKMDMVQKTRTFQNSHSTYNELLDFIGNYPDYNFVMHDGSNEPLKKLIVQYKETDWEFIKRMASHFNTLIVADYKDAKTRYHFGIPTEKKKIYVNPISFSVNKRIAEYTKNIKNHVFGFTENDAIYYSLTDREIYEIGQPISFLGNDLYVYSFETKLIKGELIHYYKCKTKNGFKTPSITNTKIIGASLAGVVEEVSTDVLRISVSEDTRNEENKKWFSYSTVYSSPDGTGWYAMPEPGDKIRLYFPSDKEEEGYAISSVHLEPGDKEQRQDPNKKSLRNKDGKEIQFTPSSLFMTNNNGLSIILDDVEGIIILSNKNVTITADEGIFIDSMQSNLSVIASERIEMVKGESKVSISDNLLFEGQEIDIT